MAAPKDNKNALGNSGGKSLNDRKLAAEVRSLSLRRIKAILEIPEKDYDLYKAILIKLSGTVLPRLNEHTGEDGGDILINVSKDIVEKCESDQSTIDNSEGQA